ncbi:MAG: ATP-binding cassette domain-containing protein, partial [Thermomicrobium sp.]|nr:ATP-binding cassette domain-containing protein [Thermomicrobium sp.]
SDTAGGSSLLEARSLTVRYGGVVAVDDVDLSVEPGMLHGVIGPNGSGKSSLLDALSGRLKPATGTVVLDGRDVTRKSVAWRRRNGIARSFQRTSVFGALTVRTQLEMVARRTGEYDLEGIVDSLGLSALLDRTCNEISYGDQRAVDIALALVGRPQVVLLDEPGAGLTHDESLRILDHIRALCDERNVAGVLVDHDVDGVFRVCDYITVLHLGRVLARGRPDEVRGNPDVIKAYLGSMG